jgi:hypothetical protein
VDYIESQRANLPMLNKLLTDGSGIKPAATPRKQGREPRDGSSSTAGKKPIILPDSETVWLDRRQNDGDRRRRVIDPQQVSVERRATSGGDRRVNAGDRRKTKQDRRSYAIMNTGTIQ